MDVIEVKDPEQFPEIKDEPSTAFKNVKFIEKNGERFAYRDADSKSDKFVLCLHGLLSSSIYFENLIPQLSRNYHPIAIDFRGFARIKDLVKFENAYLKDLMYERASQDVIQAMLKVKNIKNRILIVTGEKSYRSPEDYKRTIELLGDKAKFVSIRNTGSIPFLDDIEAFFLEGGKFLRLRMIKFKTM